MKTYTFTFTMTEGCDEWWESHPSNEDVLTEVKCQLEHITSLYIDDVRLIKVVEEIEQ